MKEFIYNLPAICMLKITHLLSLAKDIVRLLFRQFNHDSAFVWLKSASAEVVTVRGIHQQLFLSVTFGLIVKKRSCTFTKQSKNVVVIAWILLRGQIIFMPSLLKHVKCKNI